MRCHSARKPRRAFRHMKPRSALSRRDFAATRCPPKRANELMWPGSKKIVLEAHDDVAAIKPIMHLRGPTECDGDGWLALLHADGLVRMPAHLWVSFRPLANFTAKHWDGRCSE